MGPLSNLERRAVDRFPQLNATQPVQGLLIGINGLACRRDDHLPRSG